MKFSSSFRIVSFVLVTSVVEPTVAFFIHHHQQRQIITIRTNKLLQISSSRGHNQYRGLLIRRYQQRKEDEDDNEEEEYCDVDENCLLVFDDNDDDEVMTAAAATADLLQQQSSTTAANSPKNGARRRQIFFLPYDDEYSSEIEFFMDRVSQFIPIFLPIVAYIAYDPTAVLFASIIDLLKSDSWVAVDGGAYQAKIIAPVINGVVVSAISLLFAILIGQTISTLRRRQNDIQLSITMEATRLLQLQTILTDFPKTDKSISKCKMYLQQYTSRIISECHETVNLDLADLSGMDSELNGVLQELNNAASSSSSSSLVESESTVLYPTMLLDQALIAVQSLSVERSKRLTALQSTFPMLHYMILAALALSICVAFL